MALPWSWSPRPAASTLMASVVKITLFEAPVADETDGDMDDAAASADDAAFVRFVAAYVARLDHGEVPALAFAAALGDSDWEPSTD